MPSRFPWSSWGKTWLLRQSVFDPVNARFRVNKETQPRDSAVEEADEQPPTEDDQEPASDHNYAHDSTGALDAAAAAETIRQLEA